jgi:hypothetical protein
VEIFLDFTEINVGERRTVEHEFARLDAAEVHYRRDRDDHLRKLYEAILRHIFRLKRHVSVGEQNRLRLDLLDAAVGADRLIVDIVAGLLGILRRPFGDQGVNGCAAGAGQAGSIGVRGRE